MAMAKCKCVGCNSVGTVKIKTNHNPNGIWLCAHHAESVDRYTTEVTNFINKKKAHNCTFGQEFETAYSSPRARAILVENGYIPTHDGTVDVEYKSSINNGLMAFAQLFKSIDKLIESGDISLDRNSRGYSMSCGAHMHVGHPLVNNGEFDNFGEPYGADKDYPLRNFYHTLFVPLSDIMKANPEATKALYGRNFNETSWAEPITVNTCPTTHENFINLQHTHTVEFRLCKYIDADQYMMLGKMHKEMMLSLVDTFLSKYYDETFVFNNKTFSTRREYRKALAIATSKRLVNSYRKYARKLGFEV